MTRHGKGHWTIWGAVGMLLVGLAAAAPAWAQQPAGPPSPPGRHGSLLTPEDRAAMGQIFWHRMQEKLGLSEAQVKAIRDLLDAQRTTMRAEAQQLMAARKELRGLMQQASVDQGAVKQKAAQIADLQAKLFNARLQTQLDLRAQLTPEQWQQWQALRKGMGPRWGQRAPGFGPGL